MRTSRLIRVTGLLLAVGLVLGIIATSEANKPNPANENYVILASSNPDFMITSISFNPTSPPENSTFTAYVTVKNQGTVSGDGKYLDVWTNEPTIQSCGSIGYTASQSVGTLSGGISKTLTFTGLPAGSSGTNSPSAVSAGTKTFRAFVDSTCITSESDETNNQSTQTYTVTSSKPDFVITSISFSPTSPPENSTFTAYVTVKNQGTVSGDGKYLYIWTDQSTYQSCGAVGTKYQSVGTLSAGTSKKLTFTGLSAGSAGTKTFRAFVDSACITSESDESNNQSTKTYTVTSTPRVTYPTDLGVTWYRGSSPKITWSGFTEPVNIQLVKNGWVVSTIAPSASNGSYTWTILSTQTTGSDYKIQINSLSVYSQYDKSDNNFTIK